MAIQCRVEIPKVEGLKDGEMTVGRVAHLLCEGEFPKDVNAKKLHFVKTPEQKYLIHLLRADFTSPTQADFTATGYVAGEIKWPDLQMTDGTASFSLGPMMYDVMTVIPKPDPNAPSIPGQTAKQEPYGPIGPAELPVPHLYWIILVSVIGLAAALIIFKVVRVIQRRNMIERLKEHDSALSPLHQFHQTMRKLQRSNPAFFGGTVNEADVQSAMEEMRLMLRLYLTRKFKIPAIEWSGRLIIKDIKKRHRKVYSEVGHDLQALIKEFQHAFENKQKVTSSDVVNIAKRTRSVIETIEGIS